MPGRNIKFTPKTATGFFCRGKKNNGGEIRKGGSSQFLVELSVSAGPMLPRAGKKCGLKENIKAEQISDQVRSQSSLVGLDCL